jgi:hypothetical protein
MKDLTIWEDCGEARLSEITFSSKPEVKRTLRGVAGDTEDFVDDCAFQRIQ